MSGGDAQLPTFVASQITASSADATASKLSSTMTAYALPGASSGSVSSYGGGGGGGSGGSSGSAFYGSIRESDSFHVTAGSLHSENIFGSGGERSSSGRADDSKNAPWSAAPSAAAAGASASTSVAASGSASHGPPVGGGLLQSSIQGLAPGRVYSMSRPGYHRPSFREDFVCISEFSELLGPVPLVVLPNKGARGEFPLDQFVVRIQAADWQSKGSDAFPAADSHVILSDPAEGAQAFVHHMTLYDVHARGYVRPICLSYITLEGEKIYDHFVDVKRRFMEVAAVLRQGNLLHLFVELEAFVRDYEFTFHYLRYLQRAEANDAAASAGAIAPFGRSSGAEGIFPSSGVTMHDAAQSESAASDATLNLIVPVEVVEETAGSVTDEEDWIARGLSWGNSSNTLSALAAAVATADGDSTPQSTMTVSAMTASNVTSATPYPQGISADGVNGANDMTQEQDGSDRVSRPLRLELDVSEVDFGKLKPTADIGPGIDVAHTLGFVEDTLLELQNLRSKVRRHILANYLPRPRMQRLDSGSSAEYAELVANEKRRTSTDGICAPSDEMTPELVAFLRSLGFDAHTHRCDLIHTLHKGRSRKELRTPSELTGEAYTQAVTMLLNVHKHFRRPNFILRIEEDEMAELSPPSGAFSLGGAILLNFFMESNVEYVDELPDEEQLRNAMEYAVDSAELSEDSDDEVGYASPLESEDEDIHFGGGKVEGGSGRGGRDGRCIGDGNGNSNGAVADQAHGHGGERTGGLLGAGFEKAGGSGCGGDGGDGPIGVEVVQPEMIDDGVVLMTPSRPLTPSPTALTASAAAAAAAAAAVAGAVYGEPLSPGRRGDPTDGRLSSPQSSFRDFTMMHLRNANPLESYVSLLWSQHVRQPAGRGLLDLLRRHPTTLRHAVASLLRGRPLVVRGSSSQEARVRGVVNALSLFVPGASGGRSVDAWRRNTPSLSDFAHLRLVGLPDSVDLSPPLLRYVSVFDMHGEVLLAPSYHGALVDDILGGTKAAAWPTEDVFLSYVHSKLLEVSLHAALYMNMCGLRYLDDSEDVGNSSISPLRYSGSNSGLPASAAASPTGSGGSVASRTRLSSTNIAGSSGSYAGGGSSGGGGGNLSSTIRGSAVSNVRGVTEAVSGPSLADRYREREAFFRMQKFKSGDIMIIESFADTVIMQQIADMGLRSGIRQNPPLRLESSVVSEFPLKHPVRTNKK